VKPGFAVSDPIAAPTLRGGGLKTPFPDGESGPPKTLRRERSARAGDSSKPRWSLILQAFLSLT
jgi:hypothetical protein